MDRLVGIVLVRSVCDDSPVPLDERYEFGNPVVGYLFEIHRCDG